MLSPATVTYAPWSCSSSMDSGSCWKWLSPPANLLACSRYGSRLPFWLSGLCIYFVVTPGRHAAGGHQQGNILLDLFECSNIRPWYRSEMCAVQQTKDEPNLDVKVHRAIRLLLVWYVYNAESDTFMPLMDMPADICVQIHNARKALDLIDTGHQICI